MTSYTHPLTLEQVKLLKAVLTELNFDWVERPYTIYSAKKGKLNVSVYEKGPKVLVQGSETEDFVRFNLEPQILGEAKLGYEKVHDPQQYLPHFGIDESGKGDFFGPLVIAGAYTDEAIVDQLVKLGVKDSKQVNSAQKIRAISTKIKRVAGFKYQIIFISPQRYNELYAKFNNLNSMLAWGHVKVMQELQKQCPQCKDSLSDQFAKPYVIESMAKRMGVEGINIRQRTKAESDIAVAAASILAREAFIDWMDKTSQELEVKIPLGAGAGVKEIARDIQARQLMPLEQLVKTHFKTYKEL